MGFSVLLNNHWPLADVLGLIVGHLYYFLEDVYPRMPQSGGRRLLAAPSFLKSLFQIRLQPRADANAAPEVLADAQEEEEAPIDDFPEAGQDDPLGRDAELRRRRH